LTTGVFFYWLFMDTAVLEAKGVRPTQSRLAVVRGWALRIGQRATLAPAPGEAVHGVLMTLPLEDVDRLYTEVSVQMYRPVAVLVEPAAGALTGESTAVAALAYVLPKPPAPAERNPEYATRLRALAERLGLPDEYCGSIR
jgi:hypothetical protein